MPSNAEPVRRVPLRLPRGTVLLLGVTSFFTDVGSEMIFPLLPVFMVGSLGATPAFLGLVEGDATASVLKLVVGCRVHRVPPSASGVSSSFAGVLTACTHARSSERLRRA